MIVNNGQTSKNYQFGVNDRLPSLHSPYGEQPIELRNLDIIVVVSGHFAQTTQVMRFFNPNNRKLEGNLTIPLPDNGVVCGYAIDIDGIMYDGVIVPKQEARKILETEIRKGIDPGLIEHTQGNIYKTRIYPIPPKGTRTISVTYTSDLVFTGNDAAYHLPLLHAEDLEEVTLRIEVQQSPILPEISGGQGNISLTAWKNMWVAESKLARGVPTEDLQIRLPNLPDSFTMLETNSENETFFCVSNLINKEKDRDAWKAKRIAIAWDASGSRTNIERDLEFLNDLFTHWQNLTVDLQVFRDRMDDTCSVFSVKGGNADDLIRYLRKIPYDGATNLAVLDFTVLPNIEIEAWFLFSDGITTLNKGLPKIGGIKIFTFTSQAQNNASFMQYLSEQTGGRFINLIRTQTEKACAEIIYHKGVSSAVEIQGCEDVNVKEHDGRQIITGKLVSKTGSLKCFSSDIIIQFSLQDSSKGEILAKQWAGSRIQFLTLTQGEKSESVLELARKYGVVSSGTSLLVLENIEQFLEYGIRPPDSRPEMLAEYIKRIKEIQRESEGIRSGHLEKMVLHWQQRVEWWEKEFKLEVKSIVPKKPRSRMPSRMSSRAPLDYSDNFFSANCSLSEEYSDDPANGYFASSEPPSDESDILPASIDAVTTIKQWSPDVPYLKKLEFCSKVEAYREYLKQKKEYSLSPAFYFDCGAFFLSANERQTGLRILSNLMEMNLEDVPLMRMYAWRLQQAGELDQAIAIFESVLALRDDEPQSYRDLALAFGDRWEKTREEEDIFKAMDFLYKVVLQEWERFPEIEIIALIELNRLIHLARGVGVNTPEYFDNRLIKLLDLDIRISMSWDADLTDIDLHVFEPTGEHASYAHKLTAIGGLVSRDFREGYGPEEYVLHRAVPGTYQIKAHYFTSHQQTVCGPCTVTVNVFTNYGRPDEKKQVLTLRLEKSGSDFLVGEIVIKDDSSKTSSDNGDNIETIIKKLQKGMSVNQITKMMGQPQKVSAENDTKVILLIYIISDKTEIHIAFGPQLLWAKRIMFGAEVDIVS